MDIEHILTLFMSLVGQVKLFHWATKSYVHHKALDELHASLSDQIDRFVETYSGKMNVQPFKKFHVATKSSSDASKAIKYLEDERSKIGKLHEKLADEPELSNILEEMMADLSKAVYLMRLS
jgi:DNA-binding ferritin-like protein